MAPTFHLKSQPMCNQQQVTELAFVSYCNSLSHQRAARTLLGKSSACIHSLWKTLPRAHGHTTVILAWKYPVRDIKS